MPETVKDLKARLVQADRLTSFGMLAAGVAHELNNPLAYITANVGFAIEAVANAMKELRGNPDVPGGRQILCQPACLPVCGKSQRRLLMHGKGPSVPANW